MTHILSLWPAASCESLAGAVNDYIRQHSPEPESFVTLKGMPEDGKAPGAAFAELYRSTVQMSDVNPTLHIFALMPVYEPEVEALIGRLLAEAEACVMPVTLCVIGFRGWLRRAVENLPDHASPDDNTEQERISRISKMMHAASVPSNFSILDDFLANSAPINFSFNGLTRLLGEYFILLMDNFPTLFNAAVYSQSDLVAGIGYASIEFPRKKCVDFLMHKAFASALENAGIDKDVVNLSDAEHDADSALSGMKEFYSEFYSEYVERPEKLGTDINRINAGVNSALAVEREAILNRITSGLYSSGESMPQREATLALMLGKDNRYLKGMSPSLGSIFDDAFSEPLKVFVEASCALGPDVTSPLPLRGAYPELRLPPLGRDEKGKSIPNPDNGKAFDPLPDIKDLRHKIIELTGWIRRSRKRLSELEEMEKTRLEASTVLTEEGELLRRGVAPVHVSVTETSLEEQYAPAEGMGLPSSVDLRSFFGPVVSQGELPSCSCFAAAAMYEGLANRERESGVPMLKFSEGYLFYHSNILTGKPTEGSSFYEQFKILSTVGICLEELHGYSTSEPGREPGAEANVDASSHRLLKALEVPLRHTDDKFADMEANHRILCSALAEGYPVGISLRIPDDFGIGGAFISRPSDNDIALGKLYNHAMVIVGYDDQAKFYILRNSWGENFGDKGYCYVSAAYIDDPTLNNFCCFISATTDSEGAARAKDLPFVAPIGGTETEIELRSLRNTLEYAVIRLESLESKFRASFSYFTNLVDKLSLPDVRRKLLEMSRMSVIQSIARSEEMEESLRSGLSSYLKSEFKNFWSANSGISIALGLVTFGVTATVWDSLESGMYAGLAAAIGWVILMLIYYYGYLRKHKRRKMMDDINSWAEAAGAGHRYLRSLEMRFFAAGAVLDMLKDVRGTLDCTYLRLMSFNDNLQQWHREYSQRSVDLRFDDNPKFHVIGDRALLEKFFTDNCKAIVNNFDFMKAFSSYAVDTGALPLLRECMENEARKAVAIQFNDFRIADHLLGNTDATYLPALDLRQTLLQMNGMAQAMLRHIEAVPNQMRVVVAHHAETPNWGPALRPHFPQAPLLLASPAKDKITILTQVFVSPENVI